MSNKYEVVKYGKDGKVSNVDECAGILSKHGFPDPTKVKFSTWPQTWKEAYYTYRGYGNRDGDGSKQKTKVDIETKFATLLKELTDAKASSNVMQAFEALKGSVLATRDSNSETYLTALFGSEQPAMDTVVPFLVISVRSAQGGRYISQEKAVEALSAGATFKYKDADIFKMVEKVKERGYTLLVDSNARTVTFKGKVDK